LSLAIDMLSDMLGDSLFSAEELEKEKGVIVEEINMYEDNPLMYVEEMLEEMLFDGGELGHMIAGSRETVRSLDRKKILEYKNNYYSGANVVIGLAGKFNQTQLKELRTKFVFSKGRKSKIKKSTIKQVAPRVNLKHKETEQVQVALGFPAFSHHDKRSYALQLMSVILGGNMSSRLFINVREKKGLAYFVRAWPNLYEDAGAMVIQAGLDKARIEEAIVTILGELNSMKAGVTGEELKRAKDFIAGKMALDLEDSMSIAQWYANLELSDKKLMTPQEKLKKLMAVTSGDVKKVANDIFDLKRSNLAVIGPFKDGKRFKKLLK
jgi:predicted Zn-dependent peptidase